MRGVISSVKTDSHRRPRFIYLTGTDGTGKSTLTRLLAQELERSGNACQRVWLRFPFFFSIPFLAYARWRKFSWHEINGMVDHGYWDFHKSWVLRNLFPWAFFIDAFLAAIWRIYLPLILGRTIVCERFALDMVVDLSVAVGNPQIICNLPGKLFPALLPRGASVAILDLDEETIRSRRPDLQHDHALSARLLAYRLLSSQLGLPLVDNRPPVSVVLQNVLKIMGLA